MQNTLPRRSQNENARPEGRALSKQKADWTAGCIAVSDAEIEDVYAMIPDGTPILITP